MIEINKLLPCPFCDGEANLIDDDGRNGKVYSVWHQCPMDGGKFNRYGSVCRLTIDTGWYDSPKEAIAAWNTRHERTCEFVATSDCEFMDDAWIEKQCSCGEWIDVTRKHRPKYCQRCGAKVVKYE